MGLCTVAVTTVVGATSAQVGHADPDLTLEEVRELLDELHHEVSLAAEEYHQATDELEGIERRLEKAETQVERQEARLAELTADLGGYAAASYRTGGVDPTMQALLADDPEEFLAQSSVVDAYASQLAAQLDAVGTQRQRLQQDTSLVEEERARQTAVQEALEKAKDKADALVAETEELLASLEAEERARIQEQERREREEAAAQASRAAERESAGSDDSGSSDDAGSSGGAAASGRAQVAVDFALAQVGDPYAWGGTGPDAWDCSGLTQAAWAAAGVSLPRSSSQQIGVGTRVSRDQLQPGDLVFFYSPISHVALYIGNGQIVHATSPGNPVRVDSLSGHYSSNFAGATRP